MGTPHDYVLDPVPAVPVKHQGHATFEELFEIFADSGGIPLVGADDSEMGPYTHCIRVDSVEIETFRAKGFRRLSPKERDTVFVMADDFGDATD